jgi:hypothetical protein
MDDYSWMYLDSKERLFGQDYLKGVAPYRQCYQLFLSQNPNVSESLIFKLQDK